MERNHVRSNRRAFHSIIAASLVGLSILLASCGEEEKKGATKREFGQGVDLIHYRIESARVSLESEHGTSPSDRSIERMERELNLKAGSPKDHIQRVISGPSFKLVVNEEEALVAVSSQENIEHHQEVSENSPACRLTGRSDISGKATSLELDLNWNLQVAVDGESCDDMRAKMKAFVDSELQRFHMKSVNDLLSAADLTTDNRQRLKLNLQIRGISE